MNFYPAILKKMAHPQQGFAYIHTPHRGRVTHFDTAWPCSRVSDVLKKNWFFLPISGVGANFCYNRPQIPILRLLFSFLFCCSLYCILLYFHHSLENSKKRPRLSYIYINIYRQRVSGILAGERMQDLVL